MKIVINNDYGGFQLSDEAWSCLGLDSKDPENRSKEDTPEFRSNPKLVECVETLGDKANGTRWCESCLRIVKIPDDIREWHIVENKGIEYILEGKAFELTETKSEGKYILQLDGQTLTSRRYWQSEEKDYGYYSYE